MIEFNKIEGLEDYQLLIGKISTYSENKVCDFKHFMKKIVNDVILVEDKKKLLINQILNKLKNLDSKSFKLVIQQIYSLNDLNDLNHSTFKQNPLINIGTDSNLIGKGEVLLSFLFKNYVNVFNQSIHDGFFKDSDKKVQVKCYLNGNNNSDIRFGKESSILQYSYLFRINDLCNTIIENKNAFFHRYILYDVDLEKYINYFKNRSDTILSGEIGSVDIENFDKIISVFKKLHMKFNFDEIKNTKFYEYVNGKRNIISDKNDIKLVNNSDYLLIMTKTDIFVNPSLIFTRVSQNRCKFKINTN